MCLGWGFSRGDKVEGRAGALPKSSLACSSWRSRAIFTPALSPTARARRGQRCHSHLRWCLLHGSRDPLAVTNLKPCDLGCLGNLLHCSKHTHTHPPLVSSHQGEISSPDQVMLLCVLGLAAATGDPKDCSYCPSTHTASSSSPKSPLTLAHACKRHRARLPSLLWVCLLSQLVCDTLEDRDSVLLTQPPELGTRKVLGQMWELDHKEGLNAEELMLLNCRAGKDSWGSLWWQGD